MHKPFTAQQKSQRVNSRLWLRSALVVLTLLILWIVESLAPREQTLAANTGLVYLHGAWVWSALLVIGASALTGAVGLAMRLSGWQTWSRALGWTGLLFWIFYLPMSIAVMQANWGGLFFAEPRWRIPFTFLVVDLLMQAGLALFDRPRVTCLANLIFCAALALGLSQAGNVLHPDAPMFHTSSLAIRAYFGLLVCVCLASAAQIANLLHERFQ